MTTGTGERFSAGAIAPISELSMWICRCQPRSASALAECDDFLDRRAFPEMLHVVEARAAEALAWLSRLSSAIVDVRPERARRRVGARSVAAMRSAAAELSKPWAAGLHHHAALDAEVRVQREQLLLRRVGAGV